MRYLLLNLVVERKTPWELILSSEITAGDWLGFFGSLLGTFVTIISIFIAIHQWKKQEEQRHYQELKPYYLRILGSLPKYEELQTQSDYLEEADDLPGGVMSPESRLSALEDKKKEAKEKGGHIDKWDERIKRHKEYLEYWKKANEKIKAFQDSPFYEYIFLRCSPEIQKNYIQFLNGFENEHCAAFSKTNTEELQTMWRRLVDSMGGDKIMDDIIH